jgi:Flp pilus assembly pilin Flp
MQGHRLVAVMHRIGAQEGQALAEYAVILALVALLTIGVLLALGQNVSGLLGRVSRDVSQVMNS